MKPKTPQIKTQKHHFCFGPKKLVAFRLHQPLVKELEKIAKKNQAKSLTALVETVLDQYVVFERSQKEQH